jgi:cyanophycinase
MSERTISLFGSGEFLPWATDVDLHTLERATSGNGSVVVVPTASAPEGRGVFDKWAAKGSAHYEAMKAPVRVAALRERKDAFDEGVIAQLETASLIYFSGGNPAYLADTLRGTPFWSAVTEALDSGVAVSGCSAGACFLGEIAPDSAQEERSTKSWYVAGLKLLPGVMVGPHWDMLDSWQPGITSFIIENTPAEHQLVGIDEDTAVVGDGSSWKVFGEGSVTLYNGGQLTSGPYRAGDSLDF